jgi:hypothetical protein
MARTTFQGPVRSMTGMYNQGPGSVVAISSSTTLNPVDHGGRIISVGGALAATTTVTLPTINVSTNQQLQAPVRPNRLTTLGAATQSGFPQPSPRWICTSTIPLAHRL